MIRVKKDIKSEPCYTGREDKHLSQNELRRIAFSGTKEKRKFVVR